SEAESTGLVGPADVEVVEEEENEEDDQEPPRDFQGPAVVDYDETGRGMNMRRPSAAMWGLLEPQLAQVLLDRMDPQLVQSLLQRVGQTGRAPSEPIRDQDALRQMVTKVLSNIGPNLSPSIRTRRDLSVKETDPVSSAHRRIRRSLDDMAPPSSPSDQTPLLRVKRLENEDEEEENLRPQAIGLQMMKRINTMATADTEEMNHGSHGRHRRAALTYDPQVLMDQILEYLRE
ncbi:uncharacterized protein LOC119429770, partial [Nematolebias whitei]|uniref:uncharacterized protein LOC119429770 n=1 Tax=Nematolebias whitei TaxID=451745 RepID=UPI0018989C70